MSITGFTAELSSTIPAAVLFKANVHDGDKLYPTIMHGVASSAIIEGDGGVGSVRQINFTDEMPFKYWKERIDILDEANLEWKVTIFEGGLLGTKLEWASCHVKLVSAPGGGSVYKITGEHKSLSGTEYTETENESAKAGLIGMFKALDAYLIANPGSV